MDETSRDEDIRPSTTNTSNRNEVFGRDNNDDLPQEPGHQGQLDSQNKSVNEKRAVETREPADRGDVLATEDYSVFTVPQKRAIIFAASFISLLSPMTGSIYYPAIDQVGSKTAKPTIVN